MSETPFPEQSAGETAPRSVPEPLPDLTPGDVAVRTVLPEETGWRLDLFLTRYFPQYSRVLLRKAIQAGGVEIDGKGGKPAYRLKPGQKVTFTLPELPRQSPIPEEIPLEILYEDDALAVVNKPADMVVHPSRGHWSGTLVSALAYKYDELSSVRGPERPGSVHRLDRDTRGVILIAKNNVSHARLADLFQTKKIHKEYFAIVSGVPSFDSDVIDLPIGHHPKNREKMTIARNDPEAKPAVTRFEVLERFRGFSTVRALPQTGRTHQIRVHLAHVGTPVLCDKLYGGFASLTLGEIAGKRGAPAKPRGGESAADFEAPVLERQALHARRLTFTHPETGKEITVEAPIPDDMRRTLEAIRKYR